MDNETRSWLVGVPFTTGSAPAAHERPALSRGQKRELARFTGLVMASTVFFLTPLLPSLPAESPEAAPQLAHGFVGTPAAPQTMEAAAPAVAAAVSSAAPAPRTRSAPISTRSALVPDRTVGTVTMRVNDRATVAAREGARERRKGIASGLVRALVGSGRYRVQPFPTPSSGD